MHSEIKKAFLSTVALLLCIACFSAVILYPRNHTEEYERRRALDGTLELLISGSSQGMFAFNTDIMDEELGMRCYNLAKAAMNMSARYFMLNKELKQNPVKTVVIEVSADALQRDIRGNHYENYREVWESLDNFAEKLKFFHIEEIPFQEYGKLFAQSLENGLQKWATILRKEQYPPFDNVAAEERARRAQPYYKAGAYEVLCSKEEFTAIYGGATRKGAYPFQQEDCDYLKRCIEEAQEKGARVILCRLPESAVSTLTWGTYEELDAYMEDMADSYQCEYYNFELIRGKADLFPERFAFMDNGHLDPREPCGGKTFTKVFCDVITSDHPEEYFWDTYEEAALHGAYGEWVKEIEEKKGGASGAEANGEEQGQEI